MEVNNGGWLLSLSFTKIKELMAIFGDDLVEYGEIPQESAEV